MKITPDTNVLVRAIMADDARQAQAARKVLSQATLIALTLPSLCELVWVLRGVYKRSDEEVAGAVRLLIGLAEVEVNRPAVEAGLEMLEAGGDFADGIIAYEGRWLGGERFVSFDRAAVTGLRAQGLSAALL